MLTLSEWTAKKEPMKSGRKSTSPLPNPYHNTLNPSSGKKGEEVERSSDKDGQAA